MPFKDILKFDPVEALMRCSKKSAFEQAQVVSLAGLDFCAEGHVPSRLDPSKVKLQSFSQDSRCPLHWRAMNRLFVFVESLELLMNGEMRVLRMQDVIICNLRRSRA